MWWLYILLYAYRICIMVFMGIVCMFFMHIVSFKIIILISIKRSVLRFVSMLFLIFEKREWAKKLFQVFWDSYAFFNIWKGGEQKNCAGYFEIRKYAF